MIQDLIEKQLLLEQDKRKDRERSGKFSPSLFGRCYRLQVWNRLNEPQSNPPDIKSLISMKEGTIHHQILQGYLPKEQVEVRIETDDVLGFCDYLPDDCAYDFKTTEEWKFKRYYSIPTKKFREDKKENFLQVGWYALERNRDKCCIIGAIKGLLGKNSMVFHYQDVEKIKGDIVNEVETLKTCWDKLPELPEAKPRAYNGNDCQYCSYKTLCGGK
jgi:DNA-directed RNA polymerase subunit RPC12/RpoP